MAAIGGDRVIGTVLDLEDLVGTRRLVGATSHVSLPPTDPDDLAHADRESSKVYDLLNATRVASGVDPLTRSDVLDGVAAELAFDVYATGRFWTAGDGWRPPVSPWCGPPSSSASA
jgi:hypothetical protein